MVRFIISIVTCHGSPLYPRGVARPPSPERSPTLGLLLGLIITLVILNITWDSWRTVAAHAEPTSRDD